MSINASCIYDDWADNWKTFIILNGGTTNHRVDEQCMPFGTLNNHLLVLEENKIDKPSLLDNLYRAMKKLDSAKDFLTRE
jgi:hypothetical protein